MLTETQVYLAREYMELLGTIEEVVSSLSPALDVVRMRKGIDAAASLFEYSAEAISEHSFRTELDQMKKLAEDLGEPNRYWDDIYRLFGSEARNIKSETIERMELAERLSGAATIQVIPPAQFLA